MTTFTTIFGSTVTPRTRADLMQHPSFAGLNVDTEGNPCVWMNEYSCDDHGSWNDDWSCECDDECPICGADHSPVWTIWLPTCTEQHEDGSPGDDAYRLWESLPEKSDKEGEEAYGAMKVEYVWVDEAETLEDLDDAVRTANERRETATILAALRFYQSYITVTRFAPPSTWDISTDNGTIEPLTQSEIDDLCERINTKPS